jgi:hypothetical protein
MSLENTAESAALTPMTSPIRRRGDTSWLAIRRVTAP